VSRRRVISGGPAPRGEEVVSQGTLLEAGGDPRARGKALVGPPWTTVPRKVSPQKKGVILPLENLPDEGIYLLGKKRVLRPGRG